MPEDASDHDFQELPYRELIGALTYLAVATRLDIAFTVSSLSQFNNSYSNIHWTAVKRVLRYLKGTADLGLVYEGDTEPLKGFVDADWGNCLVNRRSFTGYTFILSGCAISWEARKQRTVALSSTEAEYMALSEAAKETIHLHGFLQELSLHDLTNVVVFNDNLGAKKLADNPIFHSRSKHIDLRHHFIRDALHSGQLRIEHIPTEDMTADVMTKALPRPKHIRCLRVIELAPL